MTPTKTSREEAIAMLLTLQELSRENRGTDLGALASRLVWGVGRVIRVLAHLDDKGLVDRARCRLSMGGLAVASALEAERQAEGRARHHAA